MWSAGEDAQVLAHVTSTVRKLKKHLRVTYPDSPHTRALFAKLNDVKLIDRPSKGGTTFNSGGFDHSTGTLMVAARDAAGKIRDEGALNKTVLHELAHGTRFKYPGEASHSTEWKSAFEFFLKVGTEDLGMPVDMNCSAVTFYGITDKECAGCTWSVNPGACPAFTGPPK